MEAAHASFMSQRMQMLHGYETEKVAQVGCTTVVTTLE